MLLKKILIVLFFSTLLTFSVAAAESPSVSAECAVVINAQTKEVFYEKNAYKKHSMASTTKIMTSILAVESGKLNCEVTAKNFLAEGTSIGLKEGYVLSLETLVYGMLLESGNDAAKLTANYLSGDEKNFSVHMNKKAQEIGMNSTNFVTSSGLDDENHYSTAFDMALLGAYAIENPVFKTICSSKSKRVTYISPEISKTFSNHNRLLDICDGVFGVKTGFTKKSGRCLVSACCRDGETFVAVTLNAPDDWNDHKKLCDFVFEQIETEKCETTYENHLKVFGGYSNSVKVSSENACFFTTNTDEVYIKISIPRFIYAPVSKGDVVGKISFYKDNVLLCSEDIISLDDVVQKKEKVSLYQKIKDKIFLLFK